MNEKTDKRTPSHRDSHGDGKTQEQARTHSHRSWSEADEPEYDRGYTHSHIDENGNIYTHCHREGHTHGHGAGHSHDDAQGHAHGGHEHHHVHSPQEKRAVINRLSRAIGHLESVKRMVERDEDCSEVLIQLSAVRNAINNTGKVIIKNHISHCIVEAIEQDDLEAVDALNHAIDHFIK